MGPRQGSAFGCPLVALRRDADQAHQEGQRAHAAARRVRRDRMRRELRRPGRRPRAGGRAARDGRPARVLLLDRYEVGERQTSACAAPTCWLEALGLEGSIRQTFGTLVIHTPHTTARFGLPWTFSTFDYPDALRAAGRRRTTPGSRRRRSRARARSRPRPGTWPSGPTAASVSAPLVVDALGWRRVLGASGYQPPDAPLSRGLEVHPAGSSAELEIWIDRSVVPAGYGWSFPAGDEVRVGVGSFDPASTSSSRRSSWRSGSIARPCATRATGSRTGCATPTGRGVFFAGDSAGHCLPLTAEGIRTAFYFGIALGRELRRVLEGGRHAGHRAAPLRRLLGPAQLAVRWMLRGQRLVPRVPPRLLASPCARWRAARFTDWAFDHYLKIAHPSFAQPSAPGVRRGPALAALSGLISTFPALAGGTLTDAAYGRHAQPNEEADK